MVLDGGSVNYLGCVLGRGRRVLRSHVFGWRIIHSNILDSVLGTIYRRDGRSLVGGFVLVGSIALLLR